ncbi:undecaprenyl-diphosphate phosphatase [Acetanaerobacterium elongatum]|uniref:Undecaprenyl-diphosphatase n=1 Tax=Acetanaerobacterium elongatum TaxID=258515 RepID=A0A1H0AZS0_9FIRM|nr:undecaprenyl-diphosphate phosphatase [Acetanaerobacterium elongatum]SDN38967.1 undecaprenyl-diphosphatase [Acetanaerobacterium elongatum]
MTILNAILQGILQGITEFLPVSSDGHLSLYQHFTKTSGNGALMFTVMLHLGTLIAVFVAYHSLIWDLILEFFRMIGDIFTGKFSLRKLNPDRRMILMILVATLPLAAFYFVKDFFTSLAEDNDIVVEGVLFLFTGIMLFLADRCFKGDKTAKNMRYGDALLIGTFQGLAALPAVSRSGSTISIALLRGYSREYAVAFSFILGIPAILGANIFEFGDALSQSSNINWLPIIIGIICSAVVGFFAIKLLAWMVKSDKLSIFAYYTLALGVLVIIIGAIEHITGSNFVDLISSMIA